MFERPKTGDKAILVHLDMFERGKQEFVKEFAELAIAARVNIQQTIIVSRSEPEPKYFIGTGKAEQIKSQIMALGTEIVLFNNALTPAQERNLEKLFGCRVVDRTGLILDIFAQRARSFEGKLQVELAQLQHLSTRLVRGWTHLERQKGGIGLRGPGETQLETDRRLINHRIKTIHKRLKKVGVQREQRRITRQKALLPTVSLVGYTNAGKSTLFNVLTRSDVYVANQLFATLDPTLRKLHLPGAGKMILADTVGFIRHLPHDLVEAFSATLQETREASLLLHVIDAHNPERQQQIEQVEKVLEQIGAFDIPILRVYNKIDLCKNWQSEKIIRNQSGLAVRVNISASQNLGIESLLEAIRERLYGDPIVRTLSLIASQGKLRAKLHAAKAVLKEELDEHGGWQLHICMAKNDFLQILPELVEED